MKKYPLIGPDPVSGIYILTNSVTKQVYAGQSVNMRRRYHEWRAVFSSHLGATNPALDAAIKNSNPQDWEFAVFEEAPPKLLNEYERRVIERLKAGTSFECLNGTEVRLPRQVTPNSGSVSLSRVYDKDGSLMTHAQIAAALGVTPQAIKKRLANWRRKGRTEVQIYELEK